MFIQHYSFQGHKYLYQISNRNYNKLPLNQINHFK